MNVDFVIITISNYKKHCNSKHIKKKNNLLKNANQTTNDLNDHIKKISSVIDNNGKNGIIGPTPYTKKLFKESEINRPTSPTTY